MAGQMFSETGQAVDRKRRIDLPRVEDRRRIASDPDGAQTGRDRPDHIEGVAHTSQAPFSAAPDFCRKWL